MHGKVLSKEKISRIAELRQRGFSLPEISKAIETPKTTVFRYTQGIEILPEFRSNWAGKRGGSIKRKRLKEEKAYLEGMKFIPDLTYREKILLLSSLYWAEGNKKDFSLSNTDPKLISLFVFLLRDSLNIQNDRLRGGIRLYEDLDRNESLMFWSNLTKIPITSFTGIQVLSGKKKGKLKYGMCRIRVLKGSDELKKLMGINKALSDIYVPVAQLDRATRS